MGKRTITPEFAERVLKEDNDDNFRPFNELMAENYARDMLQGNWRYIPGQTIKFTKQGKLIDGQHRLGGVVISNVSQPFFVEDHYEDDDKYFIDQGKKRTLGNILGSQGYTDSNNIAGAIRVGIDVIAYRQGRGLGAGGRATFQEVIAFAKAEPYIQFAVNYCRDQLPNRLMSRTVATYVFNECYKIDKDLALEFFNNLREPSTEVPDDSPIRALHQRLAFGAWSEVGRKLRLQKVATVGFAWNAWRNGETRNQLKLGYSTKGRFTIPEFVA